MELLPFLIYTSKTRNLSTSGFSGKKLDNDKHILLKLFFALGGYK